VPRHARTKLDRTAENNYRTARERAYLDLERRLHREWLQAQFRDVESSNVPMAAALKWRPTGRFSTRGQTGSQEISAPE